MNSMQYSDNLCQAIEIIANNVVRGLSFDKTILCTVTNNLKAKQGEYSVSDGASTFTAFSTDSTLKLKDQVYVLIPNGNHQSQKIIVSKYNSKTDINKGYSMPIDTIIPVEKLSLPTTSQGEIGIIANNSNRQQAGEFIINPNNTEYSELSFGPSYTRFSVTGKFRTNLTSVVQGDYSIVIILNGEDINTQERKDKKYIFNCSDFFGNPYQLIASTEQSIVFDISDFKKINTINIRFQESGNFYNAEGDLYPTSNAENLFVKDLEVVFGFDINEFENNDLLITSKKDLLYNTEGEKDVKLNWVRTRNNNTLFGIDSKTDIDLENYNYLRHLWRDSPDEEEDPKYYIGKSKSYISAYWYNYVLEDIPTDLLLKEDLWKVTNHYSNQFYPSSSLNGSTRNTSIFQFKFNPSITTPREKVKAVIAISGCLSKKILKTQEIEINNEIQEVVLLNTEEDSDGNLIPGLPSYDYTYYSPEDEINVLEIFDSADTEEFKAYYINNDNEYQENGAYKKEEVEWVQYYKQEELSIKENGTIEYKNGTPAYGGTTFVYLTESQFNTLKNETYTDSQDSSKIVNRYKLELTPLTLLKSNELVFINNNSNHSYEKLNLINGMKLDCLDNSEGRYFIYRLDNTIPLNVANNGNRKIQVSFNSINSADVKTDNIKIQWKIPKNNTMITKPVRIELDANLYEGVRGKINPENSDETEKESIITWSETSTHWVSNEITIKNTASGDGVNGTQVITMSIPYQIKSYYSPGFTNNKIICLVKKVVNGATEEDITINEKEFELLFGPSGTNGTSYTLTLSFGEKYDNHFNIISNEKQSFLRRGTNVSTNPWVLVEAHLFDGNNQVLDSTLNVSFSWYVNPKYDNTNNKTTVNLDTSHGTSNQCFIKSAYDKSSNDFSATQHCAILQASISYQGKSLTSYLPIPMCFDGNVYGFEGPDKIIYNSNGTSPQYYKNELKIFNQNNEEIKNSNYHYWIYINREYSGDLSGKEQKFYPQVVKDEDTNAYHLVAPEIFYQNTSKIICLRLRNKNRTVFMQPILILQNQFGNSMLNDWDGNLLIDEENNSVLAAQIAAGTKDSNNTFTGVLMGSVSEKDTDDSTPKSGLYGYHQGVLSFGFKEDGTAFIGKSGLARINFDGTHGTIESSNYSENSLGMKINLANGQLSSVNTGGSVTIWPENNKSLLQIKGKKSDGTDIVLLNIANNSYYLQSVDYSSSTNQGTKINLGAGTFALKSLAGKTLGSGQIRFSTTSPYLSVGAIDTVQTYKFTVSNTTYYLDLYVGPWAGSMMGRDPSTGDWYSISFNFSSGDKIENYFQSTGETYTFKVVSSDKTSFEDYSGDSKGNYYYCTDLSTLMSKVSSVTKRTLSKKEDFLQYTGTGTVYYETSGDNLYYWKPSEYAYIRAQMPIRTVSPVTVFNLAKNNYYLQSFNYNSSAKTGMKINLQTGLMENYNGGGSVVINTKNSSSLFTIKTSNSKILMNVGSSYYLQSANYTTGNFDDDQKVTRKGAGMKIDLSSGKIQGYGMDLVAYNTSDNQKYIRINSGASSTPIKVENMTDGTYVRLYWNGSIKSNSVDVTGKITATEGKIGNWTLTGKHFSYGSGIISTGSEDNIVYKGVFSDNKAFIAPGGVKASNAGANTPFKGNKENTEFVLGIGSRFGVTTYGTLCASSAVIEGTITATSIILTDNSINTIQKGCVTADYIQALSLSVGEGGITLSPKAKISWSTQVTGKPTILSKNDVTTITDTAISTCTISANQISGGTISSSVFETGNSTSGLYLKFTGGKGTFKNNGTLYAELWPGSDTNGNYYLTWSLYNSKGFAIQFNSATTSTCGYYLHKNYHIFRGPLKFCDKNGNWTDHICIQFLDGDWYVGSIHVTTASFNVGADNIDLRLWGNKIYMHAPVYSSSGTQYHASDKRVKNSINSLSNNHDQFFQMLRPVTFKYNNDKKGQTHFGFISQDVKQSINYNNLKNDNLALFSESSIFGETINSLSYTEFIALNTYMIQKCLKRIDELENEIKTLKAQL